MKEYVTRALQVSCMIGEHLEKLQIIEKRLGHLLPNWNIQELFKLPLIKEKYGIPEADDGQIIHNLKIEREIERKGWNKIEPQNTYLEWMHIFDWNVHSKAHEIIWDYAGRSKSGLVDRLRSVLL